MQACTKTSCDPDRVGVVFGSGIGGITTFQHEVSEFAKGDGTPRFNPFFIPKMILDIAAGQISMRHNLRGPNYAVVSACATSTNAIIDAFDLLRLGKADIVLSGGSEAVIIEAGVGGFNAMKAMSERNDDPKTASRPYDKDRDGFVMGEAAGILVLESLDHALARGARIYCEVAGGGATADAHHITAPHPEGLGARNVMLAALSDAGMLPEDIDYINTHGTSTPLGDGAEVKAILNVFRRTCLQTQYQFYQIYDRALPRRCRCDRSYCRDYGCGTRYCTANHQPFYRRSNTRSQTQFYFQYRSTTHCKSSVE